MFFKCHGEMVCVLTQLVLLPLQKFGLNPPLVYQLKHVTHVFACYGSTRKFAIIKSTIFLSLTM